MNKRGFRNIIGKAGNTDYNILEIKHGTQKNTDYDFLEIKHVTQENTDYDAREIEHESLVISVKLLLSLAMIIDYYFASSKVY